MRTFVQRPLLLIAGGALTGSFLGQAGLPAVGVISLLGLSLLLQGLACWQRRRMVAGPCLLIATVCLYSGIAGWKANLPANDISNFGFRRDIFLEGKVKGFPYSTARGSQWAGVLDCRQAIYDRRKYTVSGKVCFCVPGTLPKLDPGDWVRIRGTLYGLDKPLNPGEFNYAAFLNRQGIHARLQGLRPEDVIRLKNRRSVLWQYWIVYLHHLLVKNISEYVPSQAQSLVLSMVTGDRAGLTNWQKAQLSGSGLAHILAVSGLHVGIVFIALLGITRFLGFSKQITILIALVVVWIFAGITGAKVPVIRAAIMLTSMSIASICFRTADPLSGLALAGIGLLAINPAWSQDAGFQLSFSATTVILLIVPKIVQINKTCPPILNVFIESIIVSGAVLLGTAPLTLYYFHMVTPVALLSNIIAVPLLGVTIVSGLIVGFCAGFCPLLGHILGQVCAWSASGIESVAHLMGKLPFAYVYGWTPPLWWIIIFYIILFLIFSGSCQYWVCMILLAFMMIIYLDLHPQNPEQNETRITFLALDIGESALLETSNGFHILIDTGTEQEFFWRVKPFLASCGIQCLEAVVISHADSDHAGGLAACLSFFRVKRIIHANVLTRLSDRNSKLKQRLKHGRTESRVLYRGDKLQISNKLEIEALWPPAGQMALNNRDCLVILISSPGGSSLFPGDSPADIESQWQISESVRLLKAGHHGDRKSSSNTLLAQIRPEVVIITPGNKNPYGLPDAATLDRLRQWSALVLNTGQYGAIEVRFASDHPLRWHTWYY